MKLKYAAKKTNLIKSMWHITVEKLKHKKFGYYSHGYR